MTREAERWIPTIELARRSGVAIQAKVWWRLGGEIDLLDREPEAVHRVAAVAVRGRALRRTIDEIPVEVPASQPVVLATGEPGMPDGFEESTHEQVVRTIDDVAHRCPDCRMTPRVIGCIGCSGEGRITVGDRSGRAITCPGCGGVGHLTCVTCAGTAYTRRVLLRRVQDRCAHLQYAFLPDMPFPLEERLQQLLEPIATPPDCLRFDPSRVLGGGPYRQATLADQGFLGHGYGAAIRDARNAIDALGRDARLLRSEVRAWARPILWLRYRAFGVRREVAIFFEAPGALRAVVTDGGT